jgi:hypothetical protein
MNFSRPRFTCLASGLAVSMVLQLAPVPARAADPAPAPSAAPAQTSEQLANEAYDLHAAGKYSEAIAAYFKAYELSPAAAILFNIATIYDRKMNERELAANFYRRFLIAPDADPSLVKKATERLAGMKKEAEEEAKAKKNEAPPPLPDAAAHPAPPPPSPGGAGATPDDGSKGGSNGNGIRAGGIVLTAAGVLGVGTSLFLGLAAKSKNDQANAVCNGAVCTSDAGVGYAHTAGDFATASTATIVGSLVVLAAGVTMIIAAPRGGSSSHAAHVTFGPMLGPTEAGITAGGTF